MFGEKTHPSFKNWLENRISDGEDIEAILRDIQENLFPILEYNQLRLAEEIHGLRLVFNTRLSLVFEDAISYDLDEISGQCSELANRVKRLIEQKYPSAGLEISIFIGKEPRYYFKEGNQHCFLLLKSEGEEWILDPSFKYISKKESAIGYELEEKIDERVGREDFILEEWVGTPFFLFEGFMVSFHFCADSPLFHILQEKSSEEGVSYYPELPLPKKLEGLSPEIIDKMNTLERRVQAILDEIDWNPRGNSWHRLS